MNARDFGYEYVKAKSLDNVKMLGFINPYNSKYKFKDFYGVGGEHFIKSVAYNNQVLPHQSALDFRITSLPAKINLELYKNKAEWQSLMQKAATTDFSWAKSAEDYKRLYDATYGN